MDTTVVALINQEAQPSNPPTQPSMEVLLLKLSVNELLSFAIKTLQCVFVYL